MASSSVQIALQEVLTKFPNMDMTDLQRELKGKEKERKMKYDGIAADLDVLLAKSGDVPIARFVKLAKEAWERKYPEGREKTHAKTSYQGFLGEVMKEIKQRHPNMVHQEVMRLAGEMWKVRKAEMAMSDE
jgi:hypothetical protein